MVRSRLEKEKIKLALEDVVEYEDDEDYKNSIGRVKFLSTRPNSHKMNFSEDVLKKYASTAVNTWLIAEYSELTKDTTTHTSQQWIQGNVPQQDITFEYDEDGYLVASADVVMSKLYAKQVYDLFKANNHRAVSCELLTNCGEEKEDGSRDVIDFDICGITILGLDFLPSVPQSSIELTRFSEDEANEEYAKYLAKDKNINEKILDKLEEISDKLESAQKENKEESMKLEKDAKVSDEKEKCAEEEKTDKAVDKETAEETEEMAKDTEKETKEEAEDEKKMAENKDEDKEVVDEKTEDEKEMAEDTTEESEESDDTKEDEDEEDTKLEDVQKELAECKAELEDLRKFKEKALAKEVEDKTDETLTKVESKLSKESFDNFKKSATKCTFANVDAWVTSVFAKVGEEAVALSSSSDADIRIGINASKETNINKDVFERNENYL